MCRGHALAGDLASFEFKEGKFGLALVLTERTSDLSFTLHDGDMVKTIDGTAVDTVDEALDIIKKRE